MAGDYHLVPVLDACSRKIVGRSFGPEATSASVQAAWDKALANEGLYAEEAPALPAAHSDRGTQMTSRSTRAFFADLGIAQSFSRPRTPTDNATCESWMATGSASACTRPTPPTWRRSRSRRWSIGSSTTTTTRDSTRGSGT